MKRLTYRQQRFVEAFASCGNATEAARVAGFTGNDVTLRNTAHQLRGKPHVAAEIERAQRKQAALQNLTLDWWRREVYDGYTRCVEAGDRSNAVRHLELAGKHVGAFVEQSPTETVIEVLKALAALRDKPAALQVHKPQLPPPTVDVGPKDEGAQG